jgi:hypothetical protein
MIAAAPAGSPVRTQRRKTGEAGLAGERGAIVSGEEATLTR